MIQVGNFVQKNFLTTPSYVGVNLIREKLISHSAIVVLEEDTNNYLGVLTPLDIVQRQHNLVIDCLTKKPMLQFECKVEDALEIMHKQNAEVLPLENQKKFEGLIFKNDLVTFLSSQNIKQEKQLQRDDEEIKKSEKILNAVYNSTHSVRLLIAPDYTILFFNKKANENAISFNNKEIKIGDNLLHYAKGIFTYNDNFKDDITKTLQGEYVVRENEIQHLDNSLWFQTEYYPVYTNNRLIGVSISSRDISERKKNEIFIKKQNEALKDIIFFQSHEVRRPVANILGILQLLDTSQLTGRNKEAIELLAKTTTNFDSIIKTIVENAHSWTRTDNEKNRSCH